MHCAWHRDYQSSQHFSHSISSPHMSHDSLTWPRSRFGDAASAVLYTYANVKFVVGTDRFFVVLLLTVCQCKVPSWYWPFSLLCCCRLYANVKFVIGTDRFLCCVGVDWGAGHISLGGDVPQQDVTASVRGGEELANPRGQADWVAFPSNGGVRGTNNYAWSLET